MVPTYGLQMQQVKTQIELMFLTHMQHACDRCKIHCQLAKFVPTMTSIPETLLIFTKNLVQNLPGKDLYSNQKFKILHTVSLSTTLK
jgi:hypothetical protein